MVELRNIGWLRLSRSAARNAGTTMDSWRMKRKSWRAARTRISPRCLQRTYTADERGLTLAGALLPVRRIIREWNARYRWARFWLVRRTAVFGAVRLSPSPRAWTSSVGRRWTRRVVTRWWRRRRRVVTGWIPISLRVGWVVKIAGRKQSK